ncbi:ricin B lectin domain-containing protein [Aspergillus alliaceus]|uniref:Ricin B lectin domain-containing protein n=1 Tax=Petromyces alliaceus TaxID=209559 RepID=A0A5N6FNX0_PETAA|nr:ricin B lectin domain-containing protein [Aspergillus alliaceus]KAB8231661.1 ricin B lectin domain-containing protein [Aspergillus alliaceus]KAE8389439.1 ricin B lectin domain-containing protein [Aspergillus alliaceus]
MSSLLKYFWGSGSSQAPPSHPQPMTIASTTIPPGIYIVRNVAASTVADLADAQSQEESQVVGWHFHNGKHQRWQIADAGHSQVFFLNDGTGTYLTADEHPTAGVILTTGSLVSPTNKRARWTIESAKTKQAYIIRNVADPSRVLDLSSSDPQNGTPILIYTDRGTKNQQWTLEQLDAPPPPGVIKNTPVGGKGGTAFEEFKYTAVQVVETWSGEVEDETVVRGLRWTWDDGTKSKMYGADQGDHQVLVLGPGTKVKKSSVNSGKRVDSIVIVTEDGDEFKAGGNGGEEHKQDVGDGVLVGFSGASGLDVDRIGFIFVKKDGGQ